MRAIRCLLAAVLAAGIVTVVAAQPGGGFGFGGQDVDILVFSNTALQDEIKVTAAQKEKMKPIADKYADLTKKRFEAFKDGFDKEKMAELREEGKKVNEEAKKVRDEVLTAAQKKRLNQIEIQVMSFNVFNDPEAKTKGFGGGASDSQKAIMKEVQDALKLTDAQKSTIKTVVADFNKERTEIFKDAGIGKGFKKGDFDQEKFDAANKKVEKARKEYWGKIEEALDDSQKKTWKDLVGDAFDTSKLRPVPPKKD
jgi:hypothetical protein